MTQIPSDLIPQLMAQLQELERRNAALKKELEDLRRSEEHVRQPYRLFVDPTTTMCDECGQVYPQELVRPFRWDDTWPEILLCKTCRPVATTRRVELKAYKRLGYREQLTGEVMEFYNRLARSVAADNGE